MAENPFRHYRGEGTLIFEDGQAVSVFYDIKEPINADGTRDERKPTTGYISHTEGHPHWHPITLLHPGPFTLVINTGSRLKVNVIDMQGGIRATGEFF